jgi:cyclic beta-1,2-glucan synthetase
MFEVSDMKPVLDLPFNEFIDKIVEELGETNPGSEDYSVVENTAKHLKNLERAYSKLAKYTDKKKLASSGVEWFLDNYFVIQKAIEIIRDDLPEVYFNKLPSVRGGKSLPRIYLIAKYMITYYEIELVQGDLDQFLNAFQKGISLYMSELWALPLMLRLVLVETLSESIYELVDDVEPVAPVRGLEFVNISADEIIARSLRTLLFFDRLNWKKFFEAHSQVDKKLREDPSGVYAGMDFETRDVYRKKVEYLAEHSTHTEGEIAQIAVVLAASGTEDHPHTRHVGYYLIDEGEKQVQQRIGFKADFGAKLKQFFFTHNVSFYLGSITLITILVTLALVVFSRQFITPTWQWVLIGLASLVPASSVAVNLVNTLLTTSLPPKTLPKMDFRKGIPRQYRSVVVVPAIFSHCDEIEFLLQQIELHYLANKDKNIGFALLTDFGDAPQENMPEDQECLQVAIDGINALNETYLSDEGRRPFYLFHRLRQWNPHEGVWMGWERKRGKLADFNRFLLEGFLDSFDTIIGDINFMRNIRYVITLDSDTIMPRDSAKSLIATMAHPLNQPIFDGETTKVVRGYTILQPRTEVKPTSVIRSFFTRIYAGDLGLDLYTRAVSDVYQDLFDEGIFVGKGIYDVAAFHRSLKNKVPQNSLLSHDLFEGIQGRAGLVSDVIFYEDYPPDYASQVNRLHRWVRGDWQLLPWLFPKVPVDGDAFEPNPFSTIDLWKITDNLRRSLLAPMTLISLVLGWLFFSQGAWVWTLLILLISAFPLFNHIISSISARFLTGAKRDLFANVRTAFFRWLFWLIFLPYEALIMIDAIGTTLVRIYISRKRLLQWQTSAHTIRIFGKHRKISTIWQRMIGGPLLSLAIGLLMLAFNRQMIWVALPLLILWVISPQVAYWISLSRDGKKKEILSEREMRELRNIARYTWLYFERFIGPEDHWLPPDHYQEDPKGAIAHRTSPTNIGLMLLSTAAAYDFGYIGVFDFVYRVTYTFETLDKMEKYRGHLLNWYDTRSLDTLSPRYVSTVDSGNYAISLVGLYHSIKELSDDTICPSELFQGAADSMGVLATIVEQIKTEALADQVQSLYDHTTTLQQDLIQPDLNDAQQLSLLDEVRQHLLSEMKVLISEIATSDEQVPAEILQDLRFWAESIFNHLENIKKQTEILAPWLKTWQNRPEFLDSLESDQLHGILEGWSQERTLQTRLSDLTDVCDSTINKLRNFLDQPDEPTFEMLTEHQNTILRGWIKTFIRDLQQSNTNLSELFDQIDGLLDSIAFHLERMEFEFLYDEQREVFFLGYQVDSGRIDQNHYDLLASEARTASLFAIAQNQVPRSHWLHLARPFTSISGIPTLISWNGSMFEYLMPNLFTRTYPETLLDQTSLGVVQAQIDYGKQNKVPWGISESSYYLFDQADNYQYRGFGVPSLGRKRGLANDLVITPYASLMAIGINPHAVLKNIKALMEEGALGHFGFYESIDYTTSRLPVGADKAVIKSYMAHHQGMIFVALSNFLNQKRIIDRVHRDPRIKTTELLLQEQIPQAEIEETKQDQLLKGEGGTTTGIAISPWSPDLNLPGSAVHTLSNGRLSMLMTETGSGYLSWNDQALTRWRGDAALDLWGIWYYVQDLNDNIAWSIGRQPLGADSQDYQVVFAPHMVEIRQTIHQTRAAMQTTIMPNDDACVQRITITNQSDHQRRYRILSYGEVVLAPQAMDRGHPAFNKLFIESSYEQELNLLHFQRRLRSSKEDPRGMSHFLVDELPGKLEFTTDRRAFIGRGHNLAQPEAVIHQAELNGALGTTLDPIFSIGKTLTLNPHQTVTLTFFTIAAENVETAKQLARNLNSEIKIENAFSSSESHNEKLLRALDLGSDKLKMMQRLLSYVIYPLPQLRPEPALLAKNELGQSGLWPFGISGDYPILLATINNKEEVENLLDLILAHNYWRKMGLMIDLVIMNTQDAGYTHELNDRIHQAINIMESQNLVNQRGGLFVLTASQIDSKAQTLLMTAANVVLDLKAGDIGQCLNAAKSIEPHLPAFNPTNPQQDFSVEAQIEHRHNLLFDSGMGGFSPDGREYHIMLENYPKNANEPGQITPAPWVNVIANERFGFLVTESGGGYTWSANSGENRLTPWTNDPVVDPAGEYLYLRDEINGNVWSPTPLPAGKGVNYLVRHGQGYSVFESINQGFKQELKVYVDANEPVKFIELTLTNVSGVPRRVTGTYYVEWVLSPHREQSKNFIVPSYDYESSSLLARNTYSPEFSEPVAFLTSDQPVHGLTTDRQEFLGEPGKREQPAGLQRVGLSGKVHAGMDPCVALQVHLNIEPGKARTVTFVLGQGANEHAALEMARQFSQPETLHDRFSQLVDHWDQILTSLQVKTPATEMNLILNRWLPYQSLSSRIWGRTGLYQSSGAYGFRDQLQDVLATLTIDPGIARRHILRAAKHQFEAGDVLHWWHPPSGRGVRTRISDDLLWLVYVTQAYVETTGDISILDEAVPFRIGEPLEDGEDERYSHYETSQDTETIFEHCRRALEHGDTQGPHGLPLIGGGDWNDGMNRVGIEGKGESVWLGWFLYENHQRFADLCDIKGEHELAGSHRQRAQQLADQINEVAWDGQWYLRAFFDNGTPLGAQTSEECKIDSLPQSWAVLTDGAPDQRQQKALRAVEEHLILNDERIIQLFTPPFNQWKQDPGYIKGYPPGVRENGGQYTHAAIWAVWALTKLGLGDQAFAQFSYLNPITHSRDIDSAVQYRVEPYVVAADVYTAPTYVGMGGWTWYTGSASWLYRLGIEAILGFKLQGDHFKIEPCIPADWDGYKLTYRHRGAIYHIQVRNPDHVQNGVQKVLINGENSENGSIPLQTNQADVNVEVIMG